MEMKGKILSAIVVSLFLATVFLPISSMVMTDTRASDNVLTAVISEPSEGSTFPVNKDVRFNASGSTGGAGNLLYEWDFGDEIIKTYSTPTCTHKYTQSGNYTVTLTVKDYANASASAVVHIHITDDATSPQMVISAEPSEVDINLSAGGNTAITTIYVNTTNMSLGTFVNLTWTWQLISGTGTLNIFMNETSGMLPMSSPMIISYNGNPTSMCTFIVYVEAHSSDYPTSTAPIQVNVIPNSADYPILNISAPANITIPPGGYWSGTIELMNNGNSPFEGMWSIKLANDSMLSVSLSDNTTGMLDPGMTTSNSLYISSNAGLYQEVFETVVIGIWDMNGDHLLASISIDVHVLPKINHPPKVSVILPDPNNDGNPGPIYVGMPVMFNASATTDEDGDNLTFSWVFYFNGEEYASFDSQIINITFKEPGEYMLMLSVFDGFNTAIMNISFVVIEKPPEIPKITILRPDTSDVFYAGQPMPVEIALYEWQYPLTLDVDYGDGTANSFTITNPGNFTTNHTYMNAGTYTITVTARMGSDTNMSIKTSITITVRETHNNEGFLYITNPMEGDTFNVGDIVEFNAHVGFPDNTSDKYSIKWIFPDGIIGNTNPYERSFKDTGYINVRCEVTFSDGKTLKSTVDITILGTENKKPISIVIASPGDGTSYPIYETINFSAHAYDENGNKIITKLYWDFGDGTIAQGETIQHSYSRTGVYFVKVSATAEVFYNGSRNTTTVSDTTLYTATAKVMIIIYEGNTAALSIRAPHGGDVLTIKREITFRGIGYTKNGTELKIKWDFGDGGHLVGNEVKYKYEFPGIYNVSIRGFNPQTNAVLPGVANITIKVIKPNEEDIIDNNGSVNITMGKNHAPVAIANFRKVATSFVFDASASFDLDGNKLTYHWDFGDGEMGNGRIVNHTYKRSGIYVVELTVMDSHGARGMAALMVNVASASASGDISNSTSFMKKLGATLDLYADENSTAIYREGMLLKVRAMKADKVEFLVGSSTHEGKLIVINIADNVSFDISHPENLTVRVNSTEVKLASVSEVINANGTDYLYCITIGTEGIQLLVYFPHFSQYILTVEKKNATATGGQTSPIAHKPNMIIPIIVGIILVVIIIAVFGFLGRRDDRYYNDYYSVDGNTPKYDEEEPELEWEEIEVKEEEEETKKK